MHNIDRTYLETAEGEYEGEALASELEAAMAGEYESYETFEGEGRLDGYSGEVLTEQEEIQLTSEFLEIATEEELDRFIGKLIKKAAKGVSTFARSAAGRQLGGILKAAAKKALPIAGGAVGAMFGGPVGAKLGSTLASTAGSAFGLELEGLSAEQAEFEVARQFVRFANTAAEETAQKAQVAPASAAVRSGVTSAARQHAPGLVRPSGAAGPSRPGPQMRGRWERRGRTIVVHL